MGDGVWDDDDDDDNDGGGDDDDDDDADADDDDDIRSTCPLADASALHGRHGSDRQSSAIMMT